MSQVSPPNGMGHHHAAFIGHCRLEDQHPANFSGTTLSSAGDSGCDDAPGLRGSCPILLERILGHMSDAVNHLVAQLSFLD